MSESKYVHLVDDDEAIRHSASFMLRHSGFSVKTYEDGAAFLMAVESEPTGAILLDVRMPGIDGIEVLRRLKDRGVAMPVIILTGHGDVPLAVEAMKLGAIDFIEKPYEKQVILNAIESAFEHVEDASKSVQREANARAKIAMLTPREQEVLDRLAGGHTNKTIAADLSISARTVEIHRANLMAKLEAESLSAALKIAFAAGIGMTPS